MAEEPVTKAGLERYAKLLDEEAELLAGMVPVPDNTEPICNDRLLLEAAACRLAAAKLRRWAHAL